MQHIFLDKINVIHPLEYKIEPITSNKNDFYIDYLPLDIKIVIKVQKDMRKIMITFESNFILNSIANVSDIINIIYSHYFNKTLPINLSEKAVQYESYVNESFVNVDTAISKLDSEVELFNQIKYGNKQQLINNFKRFRHHTDVGTLSKDSEYNHTRNLLIVTVSLSTRYAIAGNVPEKEAYLLSDKLIVQIDSNKQMITDENVTLSIMLKFCDLVIKHNKINLTSSIRKVKEYIENNVYKKITLSELAHIANYSNTYLSKRFKQELKVSITDYIHQAKINEAKILIRTTNYDLSTIAQLLTFTDYSHFIKIFKKVENITPYEFQSSHFFIK